MTSCARRSRSSHRGWNGGVADVRDLAQRDDLPFFRLDTRFLSRHELRLDGKRPIVLQPTTPHANEAWLFLTNPPLEHAKRSTLGIVVHRELGGGLRETIRIENFSGTTVRFELTVSLESDFEYILLAKKRAAGGGDGDWSPRVHSRVHRGTEVEFELDEGGARHRTALLFDPRPDELRDGTASFRVELSPRQQWGATIDVSAWIGDEVCRPARRVRPATAVGTRPASRPRARDTSRRVRSSVPG